MVKSFMVAVSLVALSAGGAFAQQGQSAGAMACAQESKAMQAAFGSLAVELRNPIDGERSRQLLDSAGYSLRRAQDACRSFPDLMLDLNDIARDLVAIEQSMAAGS